MSHRTGVRYAPEQSVHGVFLHVAARYPDRPALVGTDGTLTYAALEAAGRRVAAGLVRAGVGPGDVVPVLLPRSPRLVAVLLGVLMRGAAYAALDTGWPAPRVRAVLDAIGARTLVGDAAIDGLTPWAPPADAFEASAESRDVAIESVAGDEPCCVFVTSGSTGTPKPVLSPHRATTRLFEPGAMHGRFGPGHRIPQWAPVPWDAFSLELWSALLTGGTCVLCEERLPTPWSLRQMIASGVNSLWLTGSLFNLIVDEDPAAFAGLRQVWTGGERLSTSHVRRFVRRYPGIALVNGYGPAESCVFVTTHLVRLDDCDDPDGIPLGSPVDGTSVVILDGDRICAAGEPGEICVGGDGLAIGYLGDQRLTDDRFVRIDLKGRRTRLYRTGDRGRLGSDGLLRFLGRADGQVKLRGFRVEPGEVEAHVRAAADADVAVVLPDHDGTGACVGLTGFYVPRPGARGADPDSVRDRLRAGLPSYLVPGRLVAVPRISVTANGKADHAALRRLADATVTVPLDSAEPPDSTVDAVAATVAGVLGTGCGPTTQLNHGTLTSLQAVRVCLRLNQRFADSVTPEQVTAAATVERLADLVRQAQPTPPPAGPIGPADIPYHIPLADTQVGFVLEHALRPRGVAGRCLIAWLVDGPFDRRAFERALTDVQERHEALRARYHGAVEPYLETVDAAPVRLGDLGEFAGVDDAWAAAQADLLRPLDIGAGQIWRADHAGLGADRRLLAVAVQHIAYDGWSESILVKDLSDAYAARRAGRRPSFSRPAGSLSRALADRRAEVAGAMSTTGARDYWSHLLGDLPEHRQIRPSTGDGPDAVARCVRELPPGVFAGADRVARRLGTTRFPVLVAGYARALADTFGQDDFGVGVPVSVRRHASQAEVVTCLVDTVCLRLNAGPTAPLPDVALRAEEQMRAARGTFALPFPAVVRAVNPARRAGRNPLFRTLFAYQDLDVRPLVLVGARSVMHRRFTAEPMCELVVEVWPSVPDARVEVAFHPDAAPARSVVKALDSFINTLRSSG